MSWVMKFTGLPLKENNKCTTRFHDFTKLSRKVVLFDNKYTQHLLCNCFVGSALIKPLNIAGYKMSRGHLAVRPKTKISNGLSFQ